MSQQDIYVSAAWSLEEDIFADPDTVRQVVEDVICGRAALADLCFARDENECGTKETTK